MNETKTNRLKSLAAAGMKMRYGDKPDRAVILRILWELKHIIDAGFEDHYIMAFWIFRHYAETKKIGYWGRGAMCSSIVCYCLGLSEVDPLRFAGRFQKLFSFCRQMSGARDSLNFPGEALFRRFKESRSLLPANERILQFWDYELCAPDECELQRRQSFAVQCVLPEPKFRQSPRRSFGQCPSL